MFRHVIASMLAFCILVCPAFAERKQKPARASAFELARRNYESGKYSRALDLFAQAIRTATDASLRNKGYYYQGLILFEQGLYYSSYVSFRNVLLTADDKNKEVYEKAIKNAVMITDRLNITERLGKTLEKLPGAFIPASAAAHANYAIGVYYYKTGNDEKAAGYLKSVNPENTFFNKSLMLLGILSTKQKKYKEASYYFEKVMDNTRNRRDERPLNELARLNLARSVYSAGDIERSIDLYSRFVSSSPHWLTILLEASWPLLRVNDTTVSLGNLHTVLSPFYREDLVGEGYILRATILFNLCKYEEMRKTLAQFFAIYDPIVRRMQSESSSLNSADAFFRAFTNEKGINRAFINYAKRDEGVQKELRVLKMLKDERLEIARLGRNDQLRRLATILDEAQKAQSIQIGNILQRMHKSKLADLIQQREQANYLKVEIVTGEKELIEGQKGLPPKRMVDVETSVADAYHFWPFVGEYWEDELGTFVYTTESSCVI